MNRVKRSWQCLKLSPFQNLQDMPDFTSFTPCRILVKLLSQSHRLKPRCITTPIRTNRPIWETGHPPVLWQFDINQVTLSLPFRALLMPLLPSGLQVETLSLGFVSPLLFLPSPRALGCNLIKHSFKRIMQEETVWSLTGQDKRKQLNWTASV